MTRDGKQPYPMTPSTNECTEISGQSVLVQTATSYTTNCSARQESSWQHLVLFCNLSPAQQGSGIELQGITHLCPNELWASLPFKSCLSSHHFSPKRRGKSITLLFSFPFCFLLLSKETLEWHHPSSGRFAYCGTDVQGNIISARQI